VETRQTALTVPDALTVRIVDFATADNGYALLVGAAPVKAATRPANAEYRAALFATTDGGRTWSQLRHPRPVSRDPNMFVGAGDRVVVSAFPSDWYISADGGKTFSYTKMDTPADLPLEYLEASADPRGPYRVICDQGPCKVYERPGKRTVAVPAQPKFEQISDVRVDRAGRIWVAGTDRNQAGAAMSPDGGRTWRRADPPAQDKAARYMMMRFAASHDGADLWLVGYREPGAATGACFDRSARQRKEMGLPDLWRLDAGGWVSRGTGTSRPAPNRNQPEVSSVVAVGGGRMLVLYAYGLWLVDGGWTRVTDLPRTPAHINGLRDGTIHAMVDQDTRYLGRWDGRAFTWVRVTLTTDG